MKSFRIIFLIALITFISLGYVHSEIEIIKLGYTVKSNHVKLTKLIDQNRILMYNVSSLKSPSYLEKALIAYNKSVELCKETGGTEGFPYQDAIAAIQRLKTNEN